MNYIVDTNVPLKAAQRPENEIDKACASACLNFISDLMKSKDTLVIDSQWEILNEYLKYYENSRQDTVATEFFKWVLQNIRTTKRIDMHNITKTAENTYVEFPSSSELVGFDLSDRKFVALAIAHPAHPPICNGSDTDWWIYRNALSKQGIKIKFLCKEYMIAKTKM